MVIRQNIMAPGEMYHVYTRGVDRMDIFKDDQDRIRFLNLLLYYLSDKNLQSYSLFLRSAKEEVEEILFQQRPKKGEGLVDIICYCIMDNHVHLLLRENKETGITTYLRRALTGYAKYFNTRYERQGPLFSGAYKIVRIAGDEQFLHVVRYIHLNPFAAGMVKDPFAYKWLSIAHQSDDRQSFCHTERLFEIISVSDYREFVTDYASYIHEQEKIADVALD